MRRRGGRRLFRSGIHLAGLGRERLAKTAVGVAIVESGLGAGAETGEVVSAGCAETLAGSQAGSGRRGGAAAGATYHAGLPWRIHGRRAFPDPMSSNPIPRGLGVLLILGVATAFGANHVAARVAFDHGASVISAIAVRSAGTALFVTLLMKWQGVPFAIAPGKGRRALVVGVLVSLQSYCLYSAVARIPVALALLAFNTYPLLLSLISWLAGGERPSRRTLWVMPVALAGLALALDVGGWSGGRVDFRGRWDSIGAGVLFALGAAASFAGALFLTTRWLGAMDGRLRSVLAMSTVAVIALTVGISGGGFAWPRDATGWSGLAMLTAFYALAFTSAFVLLPRMGAVNNAALMNFEPVAVLLMGWIILGQSVAPLQLLGSAIVVGAIVALALGKR